MAAPPSKQLLEVYEAVMDHRGPHRIVINSVGHAVPPEEAMLSYCVVPEVVYIRYDYWSLGAPLRFAEVAHSMYRSDWIGRMDLREDGNWDLWHKESDS